MTYRDSELVPPAPKPRTPFLWGLRVWWASIGINPWIGKYWSVELVNDGFVKHTVSVHWKDLATMAEKWAKTPAGESCAVFGNDGDVWFMTPPQVPTVVRLARQAADAWERSK